VLNSFAKLVIQEHGKRRADSDPVMVMTGMPQVRDARQSGRNLLAV
jgi:hypothetical protein